MLTLTRWEPFREMINLQNRMSRLLSDTGAAFPDAEGMGPWLPPVDITEEPERLVFKAEIPGVSKDDIDIKVENGTLTLRGEKRQEKEVQGETSHRIERFYGSFSRSFLLPNSVSTEKIQARYKDGVLEVVLPKAEESKPRRIKILES